MSTYEGLVKVFVELSESQTKLAVSLSENTSALREMRSEIKEGRQERVAWRKAMEKHTTQSEIRTELAEKEASETQSRRAWLRGKIDQITPVEYIKMALIAIFLSLCARFGLNIQTGLDTLTQTNTYMIQEQVDDEQPGE